MEIAKLVEHWRASSAGDFAAAESLFEKDHPRQALFFAHLAIEKMLKAHVSLATQAVPPRIHDLLRLADLARLALSAEGRVFLARFQRYCLEGRYPDLQPTTPPPQEVPADLAQAREMLEWLTNQLP